MTDNRFVPHALCTWRVLRATACAGQGGRMSDSPAFCEHANECPARCPCKPGCYCKTRTCRARLTSRALAEIAITASKGYRIETWEAMAERLAKRGVL